ncbi:MAG: NAD(P)H-dependent oxidoreductase subunit E [Campylobacterales bacterium]|nr:NAD(P)H-dependent oxidoreductase subunit E [Campylobacterales bacterium]
MFTFTPQNLQKIEALKSRYPSPNALALPLLWMVQEQEGTISLEAMEAAAPFCDLPPIELYRIATFYTMFKLAPTGRHHIQLCKTLSCALCGKAEILAHLQERLGIGVGEMTPDGRFSLEQVECLGSCGTAPVMQINDVNFENLTPKKIDEILKALS